MLISLPILLGLLAVLVLLKVYLEIEKMLFKPKKRLKSPSKPTPIPQIRKSPYKDHDFELVNGEYSPKALVIHTLMEYIDFKVEKPPYVSILKVTIDVSWRSSIEVYYDKRWEQGEIRIFGEHESNLDAFDNIKLEDPYVQVELEKQAMCYVWNFYYSRYPEIFRYPVTNIKSTY